MDITLPQVSNKVHRSVAFVTGSDGKITISFADNTGINNLAHVNFTPDEAELLMYEIQRKVTYLKRSKP